MERIVKLFCFLLIIIASIVPVNADTVTPSTIGAPQLVTLPQCIKTFNVGYKKLLFLTEAAISQNGFEIDEIQTQGGYIVFTTGQYKFLATVFTFGANKAILKITPCNNNYTFPPLIIRNIFRYIEINQYKKF